MVATLATLGNLHYLHKLKMAAGRYPEIFDVQTFYIILHVRCPFLGFGVWGIHFWCCLLNSTILCWKNQRWRLDTILKRQKWAICTNQRSMSVYLLVLGIQNQLIAICIHLILPIVITLPICTIWINSKWPQERIVKMLIWFFLKIWHIRCLFWVV